VALLTRAQAAAELGLSVRQFDEVVRPTIPVVQVGARGVRFDPEDLKQWVDRAKASHSDDVRDKRSGKSASLTKTAGKLSSAQAKRIATKQRGKPRACTESTEAGAALGTQHQGSLPTSEEQQVWAWDSQSGRLRRTG
jgi:hypothetical protein